VRAAHRPSLCRSTATVDGAVARVGHISLLGGWSCPRLFAQCGGVSSTLVGGCHG
jgi:hypothetical protein